jgi:hypothetical protein
MGKYETLIERIEETIRPNNAQSISGQSLQNILVAVAEHAHEETDDIQYVITTSIEPTLNAKVSQPTFDLFQQGVQESIDEGNAKIGALEAITKNQADDIKEAQLDAGNALTKANNAITIASETKESIPTKVSQLDNDKNFVTASQVQGSEDSLAETLREEINGATADKSKWVRIARNATNGNYSISITPNTFYVLTGNTTGLSVSVITDVSIPEDVLEGSLYAIQFTTGEAVDSIVFPSWWQFQEDPVFEPNKTYQVTVVNGYALMTSWPK